MSYDPTQVFSGVLPWLLISAVIGVVYVCDLFCDGKGQ
jgi:hypothetical protein